MPKFIDSPLFLGGLAAGLGGLAWWVNRRDPDGGVADVFLRGNHISFGTYDPTTGLVLEAPEALRAAAEKRMGVSLDRNAYAGSRMVRSEGAKAGALRMHVAMNDLATFPYADDLFELLTYSTDASRRGVYGAQYSPPAPPRFPNANRRRYATSKEPYEGDARTALQAIAERAQGIDRAMGATKFVDVASLSSQPGAKTFDQIKRNWGSEGLQPFTLDEYGPDLVLFKKA